MEKKYIKKRNIMILFLAIIVVIGILCKVFLFRTVPLFENPDDMTVHVVQVKTDNIQKLEEHAMNESQKEKLLEYFSKCKKQRTLDIDNGKWSVEEVDIYMYLSDARQHESYIVRLGKSNIIFNTNDSIIYKICDGDIVNADIKEIIYS